MLPYDERLALAFPAYLQQLEMESNGKRVALDGLAHGVGDRLPVVWGEPGNNAQHSLLPDAVIRARRAAALDFLLPARSSWRTSLP